jgi:hypothetical protein
MSSGPGDVEPRPISLNMILGLDYLKSRNSIHPCHIRFLSKLPPRRTGQRLLTFFSYITEVSILQMLGTRAIF